MLRTIPVKLKLHFEHWVDLQLDRLQFQYLSQLEQPDIKIINPKYCFQARNLKLISCWKHSTNIWLNNKVEEQCTSKCILFQTGSVEGLSLLQLMKESQNLHQLKSLLCPVEKMNLRTIKLSELCTTICKNSPVWVNMAVLIPIKFPLESNKGPPLYTTKNETLIDA